MAIEIGPDPMKLEFFFDEYIFIEKRNRHTRLIVNFSRTTSNATRIDVQLRKAFKFLLYESLFFRIKK